MNNHLTSPQKYSIWIGTIILLAAISFWNNLRHQDNWKATKYNINQDSVATLDDSKHPTERLGSASIWFEQSFDDGDSQVHAIFTKTPHINEDGTALDCHACGVVIGVITYKQVAGKWEFISMQPSLAELGQWGNVPDNKPAEILRLAPDNLALFINERDGNQGQYEEWMSLLAFSKNNWLNLGSIKTGEEDSRSCLKSSQLGKDNLDGKRCWSYKGKVSTKAGSNAEYPELQVTLTGTNRRGDTLYVVPANQVITYIFNGKKYIESKTELNTTKLN